MDNPNPPREDIEQDPFAAFGPTPTEPQQPIEPMEPVRPLDPFAGEEPVVGPDAPLPPDPPRRPEAPPPLPWAIEPLTPQPGMRPAGVVLLAFASGLLGAAVLAVVLALSGALDTSEGSDGVAALPTTVVEIREIVTEGTAGPPASSVAKKVVPSIVTVEVGNGGGEVDFQPFGSGSGVVLTGDGLIATNHHVIDAADGARVIFQDGRIYSASVIGSDALTDIAVLQIETEGLIPIELGATSSLSIGDTAIAVGNPLGLRGGASLTVGVVSAFNREVGFGTGGTLFGMLQTDAPITEGSSGGALVDQDGRLIGITTAIGVSSAGAEGIGFAIPVELVQRITDEIVATGDVNHAFLGIQLEERFEDQPDGSRLATGVAITGFAGEPSAAQAGGLQTGDVIVRFDTAPVRTREDLVPGIRLYRVGDVVEVEVLRAGQTIVAEITLGERPDNLSQP